MCSDRIDIYIKGKAYAEEAESHIRWLTPSRIRFLGRHAIHELFQHRGEWFCNCKTFETWRRAVCLNYCPHIVAIEIAYPEGFDSLLCEVAPALATVS